MGFLDNVRDAAKLAQQIGNIELYEKLIGLQVDAMAMVEENWKLKKRYGASRNKVKALEAKFDLHGSLQFQRGDYYRVNAGLKEGPFCHVCWDIDQRLRRLQSGSHGMTYCLYRDNHRGKNNSLGRSHSLYGISGCLVAIARLNCSSVYVRMS